MATDADLTDLRLPVETFRPFYDAADALVDEVKLRFSPDGLRWSAVDPANVGQFHAELSADAFEDYWPVTSEDVVGLAIDDLDDYLKTDDEEATLTISTPDSEHVRFGIDGFDWFKHWIDAGKLRAEPDSPDQLTFPADVALPIGPLRAALQRADMVGNHAVLSFDPETKAFVIEVDGDTDEGYFRATPDDHLTVNDAGVAWTWFSLDYLTDMVEAVPDGTDVRIRLGEEFPLRLNYEFADGAGTVEFWLAPRIGGPDDD